MKFTQEEAFEKLKGILTIDGKKTLRMSERSIKSQLETLLPLVANDETELEDFCNKYKNLFETMNSNAEKDSSDFVNKWKSEHPDKKDEPSSHKEESNEEKSDLQVLLDEIKNIKEELNAEKVKKSLSAKREELSESIKKKGVKDTEWISGMLDNIAISEDMDVEAKSDSILKLYNLQKANVETPKTPHSSGGGSNNNNLFDDIKEEMKKHEEGNNF